VEALPSQYWVTAEAVPDIAMQMAARAGKRWDFLVFMVG
jgi:hypothetical protein